MRSISLFLFSVLIVLLTNCKKDSVETEENEETTYTDRLYTYGYNEQILLDVVDTLDAGEVKWFEFEASQNEVYNIEWEDAILENHTASSIYISVYHEDTINSYFTGYRLIQMTGSARTIIPSSDETIYIKIEGYDSTVAGSFSLTVKERVFDENQCSAINSKEEISILPGETKLFYIDSKVGESYKLQLNQTSETGAYGNSIQTMISCYFENSENVIFEREFCMDSEFSIEPSSDGKYIIVMNGAYWWDEAKVDIELK